MKNKKSTFSPLNPIHKPPSSIFKPSFSILKPPLYKPEMGLEIQISPTDFCDFQCIMCMQTAHLGLYGNREIKAPIMHKGRRGFMDLSLFARIIKGLKDSGLKFRLLKLQWMGEALIHPSFDSILAQAGESGLFPKIIINTNGSNLCDEIGEIFNRLVDTRIILVMSLDAITPSTYAKIKGQDLYHQVLENFSGILKKCPNIIPVAQMIVMEENFHEAPAFLDFWSSFFQELGTNWDIITDQEAIADDKPGARIFFKKVGGANDEELSQLHRRACLNLGLISQEEYKGDILTRSGIGTKSPFSIAPPPCPAPFRTPLINWDGRITTCCMDTELENCFGDLKRASFDKIWLGPQHLELRRAHLLGDRDKLPRCLRCINLDAAPLCAEELGDKERALIKI